MKVVIIDNYDSFTYNLAHLVKKLGAEVTVIRNDKFVLDELEQFDKIILSPGPGIPEESGLLLDVIKAYAGKKPMLGVCLGEQAMAVAMGGSLINLREVYHGVQTTIALSCNSAGENIDAIFAGLSNRLPVGRYHSWVVDSSTLPACFVVTAMSHDGHIMAICHKEFDMHGIQFHPESVLTPQGETIMNNWLHLNSNK